MGDIMTIEEVRAEFGRQSFRDSMKEKLGNICVNCGSTESIEYHHIVPIINGGSNNLSNIVPLCYECHCKAHDKAYKHRSIEGRGRPKIIDIHSEEFKYVYDSWASNKIGSAEAMQILNIAKSPWCKYKKEYEEVYNLPKAKNSVDLLNAQAKRISTFKGEHPATGEKLKWTLV